MFKVQCSTFRVYSSLLTPHCFFVQRSALSVQRSEFNVQSLFFTPHSLLLTPQLRVYFVHCFFVQLSAFSVQFNVQSLLFSLLTPHCFFVQLSALKFNVRSTFRVYSLPPHVPYSSLLTVFLFSVQLSAFSVQGSAFRVYSLPFTPYSSLLTFLAFLLQPFVVNGPKGSILQSNVEPLIDP
jgi:hypothetical protein